MLHDRLWVGALLILLVLGVLVVDQWFAPWYPILLLLILVLSLLSCLELCRLLPESVRPPQSLALLSITVLVLANWPAHLLPPDTDPRFLDPWHWIFGTYVAVVLIGFLWAMAKYDPQQEAGSLLGRLAFLLFLTAYLGLLPAYLAQLRWPREVRAADENLQAVLAIAMTIFVTKCCDIGGYFTGRMIGKHKMSPSLSPGKTWEGLAGGLTLSILVAVGLNQLGPVLPGPWWIALGFGFTVALAGVMGDLAESLIKRECKRKDASQAVPGFGGVLDVVDSILFASPVAFAWLMW